MTTLFRPNAIFFDACAFNPGDENENLATKRLLEFNDKRIITIYVTYSVREEIAHPSTPEWISETPARPKKSLKRKSHADDSNRLEKIIKILTGRGNEHNYSMDAQHLFQAYKKKGKYFITTDKEILEKACRLK